MNGRVLLALAALAFFAGPALAQTCACTKYESVAQGMSEDLGTAGCQIKAYTEAQIRAALK